MPTSTPKRKTVAAAEVLRLRRYASMGILVSAVSGTLWAQIPEQSKWGIAFPQVEAAAGLPDLKTAPPGAFEARLMLPSENVILPMRPIPFLRLFHAGGTVRAQLFVYWAPRLSAGRQPVPTDLCREGVCVTPVEIKEQHNWEEILAALEIKEQRNWGDILATLAQQDACPTKANPEMVTACPHCERIWIKTTANGKYREQSCSEPLLGSPASGLLQLMNTAARAYR